MSRLAFCRAVAAVWFGRGDTMSGDEPALYRRLRKYGSRGIIEIPSPEGHCISLEAAQYLVPAEGNAVAALRGEQ